MTQTHGFVGCAGGTTADPLPWLQMQLSAAAQAGIGGRIGRQRLRISHQGGAYQMEFYNPGPAGTKLDLLTLGQVPAAELGLMFTYATGIYTATTAELSAADWLAWMHRATVPATRYTLENSAHTSWKRPF